MKKLTVHVHTTDAEHWVTMNGAAVLVDGTEGSGFTVKGGAGGKLTGLKVNPKSMSEPRLNAKTSQFNRPDFKPHEPEPPKPVAPTKPAASKPAEGGPKSKADLPPDHLEKPWKISADDFVKHAEYKRNGNAANPWTAEWNGSVLSSNGKMADHPTLGGAGAYSTSARLFKTKAAAQEAARESYGRMLENAKAKGLIDAPAAPKAPQAAEPAARQYISAAKLDHPSVGALNNATAQKEAAHARLKSINRKDDPLGHLKADSAHRDAVRNEASAKEAVEAAANRLGFTTVTQAGAKKAAGEAEKLGALKEQIGGEAGASSEEGAAKKDFTGAWIARNFPAPKPGQRVRASQMVSEAVKQEKAEAAWSAHMAPNKVKARELLAKGGKDWQGERVYFNGIDIGAVGDKSDVYFDVASGKWHGAPEAVSKIKSKFGG